MENLLIKIGIESGSALFYVLMIAVTLVVCFAAVNIINLVIRRAIKRRSETGKGPGYLPLVRYLLLVAAFFVVISAVSATSINEMLRVLLTGSGVAAIVISVACQETIGNIVSGVTIIMSKPFQVGDVIRYIDNDISGTVEGITLRHTVIRTFENKRLIVPNGTINKSAIENTTYSDNSRICLLLDFGVTLDSDLAAAQEIIRDVALLHPKCCDTRTAEDIAAGKPAVRVLVTAIKESSITIRAWIWSEYDDYVSMRSDILVGVTGKIAESDSVRLAIPRVLFVEGGN